MLGIHHHVVQFRVAAVDLIVRFQQTPALCVPRFNNMSGSRFALAQ